MNHQQLVPTKLSNIVSGTVNYIIDCEEIHSITKNRLIKVCEQHYSPWGWNSKITQLLECLNIPIGELSFNSHSFMQSVSEENKKKIEAYAATLGFKVKTAYRYYFEPYQGSPWSHTNRKLKKKIVDYALSLETNRVSDKTKNILAEFKKALENNEQYIVAHEI